MSRPRFLRQLRAAARQIRAVAPVRIRDGVGANLRMDLRHASAWYGHGTNEMPIQLALAAHIHPGDVFYDIGANVGFFTLIAARLVGPKGRVIAFEPVAANAAAIRRNVALNHFTNISVVEAAIADREGEGELLVTDHGGGAALASVAAAPSARPSRAVVRAATTTIDALIARGEIPPPSMVKIDVEGAEREVLRGMSETMRSLHPKIVCEVDDASSERLEPRLRDVQGMLESAGYRVERLDPAYPHLAWAVAHLLALPAPAVTPAPAP